MHKIEKTEQCRLNSLSEVLNDTARPKMAKASGTQAIGAKQGETGGICKAWECGKTLPDSQEEPASRPATPHITVKQT